MNMTNPSLYVLAHPSFTNEYDRFLASEELAWSNSKGTDAERIIEFAGRICYMSFGPRQSDRNTREYIDNLIAQGHESVLEHASWTFLLTGVSRAFTHQLVRHRIGFSFSQLSQQYHDESDAAFVAPDGLDNHPEALKAWSEAVRQSRDAYRKILSKLLPKDSSKETTRAIRSAARSVLPNATETKIVVTANARAIRHFLLLRGDIEGDVEMRRVSALIYEMVKKDGPSLVADFHLTHQPDGTPAVRPRTKS